MPLIPNNGWESGDAGGWTLAPDSGSSTAEVSTSNPRSGTYALRLIGAAPGEGSEAYYENPDFADYQNKVVEFLVWIENTATTSGIFIDDGVGETGVRFKVLSAYTQIRAVRTIDGSATKLKFRIRCGANTTVDADDMIARETLAVAADDKIEPDEDLVRGGPVEDFYNTVTVGTAGTQEKVTADNSLTADDNKAVRTIEFRARAGNSGVCYVGGASVASTRGRELAVGGSVSYDFGDGGTKLSDFYVDAATDGDIVDVTALLGKVA